MCSDDAGTWEGRSTNETTPLPRVAATSRAQQIGIVRTTLQLRIVLVFWCAQSNQSNCVIISFSGVNKFPNAFFAEFCSSLVFVSCHCHVGCSSYSNQRIYSYLVINDDEQDATIQVCLFIPCQLYMFRAMYSPIIRSTLLYLQLLVLLADVAAGWCHG